MTTGVLSPDGVVVTAVRFALTHGDSRHPERHRSILRQRRKRTALGVRNFGCTFKNPGAQDG